MITGLRVVMRKPLVSGVYNYACGGGVHIITRSEDSL